MALTQVRALINGEWMILTYNPATGRYERKFTAPGTSIHQPGGLYNVEVEAANQTGEVTSINGTQLPSLRLVTYETAAPTLTLVSPLPGFLTTQTPTFVFEAVDEEGGSGIDPDSFSLAGASAEAIPGGYRFTWTPPDPWTDGPHTVTASVSDYDGNEATVSGAYTVDTVPPVLYITRPYMRHVVDTETVEIVVEAYDEGSGVAEIAVTPSVSAGGADSPLSEGALKAPIPEWGAPQGRGEFSVPLKIGENHIPVTVTDGAGNQTGAEVYMIRLVTDRTSADAAKVLEMCKRGEAAWTEEERDWWEATLCLRGTYDDRDLNRVGVAVEYLAGELRKRGYIANVQPKTDWTEGDAPVRSQMETYLSNVETVRSAQGVYIPEIPVTMRKSGVEAWNQIEATLVDVDAVFPKYTAWTAGEITCGGV